MFSIDVLFCVHGVWQRQEMTAVVFGLSAAALGIYSAKMGTGIMGRYVEVRICLVTCCCALVALTCCFTAIRCVAGAVLVVLQTSCKNFR